MIDIESIPDYSQNGEQKFILQFFKDKPKGAVLDIGANDGKTLSNSYALIHHMGWSGVLVEPSPKAFEMLSQLHKDRDEVCCIEAAIGEETKQVEFYDSGTHLNQGDVALLSTMNQADYNKWKQSTEFKTIQVSMVNWPFFLEESPIKKFDFISIDAEGNDFGILKQIDLDAVGCSCICVEHNGAHQQFHEYLAGKGFKTILMNQENLLMSRSI